MSKPKTTIELSLKHQAFAEEQVRRGQNASVDEVVHDALEEKKHSSTLQALDAADYELDAGLGKESTIEEFMIEIDAAVGLTP